MLVAMIGITDPLQAPSLGWGVLGAGWIADVVCASMRAGTRQRLVAVGARDGRRAQEFAAKHGAERWYGSYEELVQDPGVDVVYVATPHSHHLEHALLAIGAGKNVLVEKAFTRNAAEARELVAAARKANVFLMEAMWTRFLPRMVTLRDMLGDGVIGDIVEVTADHGQGFAFDPAHRLYNPALAGGALLDLGVYPVAFVVDLLGVPERVVARGSLTQTGVDGEDTIILDYGDGAARGAASTTLWARTPTVAWVAGTGGRVFLPGDFYQMGSLVVDRRDGSHVEWSFPGGGRGYEYELAEVARRVSAGEKSSPLMTPEQSVAIMEVLDSVRAQVGVVYPGEGGGAGAGADFTTGPE
jgi:predicted dehydrogenase